MLLEVFVLGRFEVRLAGQPVGPWPRAGARRLMQLLACQRSLGLPVTQIASHFWPRDQGDRVRQRVHHLVHLVRKTLAGSAPAAGGTAPRLEVRDGVVRLGAGAHLWVDAIEFEREADAGLGPVPSPGALERAAALYQGPLLPGDDEWCEQRRQHLAERHQAVQQALARQRRHAPAGVTGTAAPAATAPLPSPLAPLQLLVGREELARMLSERLASGARLVTLTGVGGVGKTQLASHVALAMAGSYRDGLALANLSEVGDDGVLECLGRAVHASMAARDDIEEALVAALHEGQRLLLIDNCEHVHEALGFLPRLLAQCPGLTILATSRRRLNLSIEEVLPVPGLEYQHRPGASGEALWPAAAQLFAERARAADPSFELTASNAGDVLDIVQQLEGVPLAIELVAARLHAFSPSELRAALADGQGIVAGGGADRPPRHRSMESSLAWSLGLLGAPPRQLLDRLSLFAAPFDFEIVHALGADIAADAGLSLQLLMELKLVVRVPTAEGRAPRLVLHGATRRFVRQRAPRSAAFEDGTARFIDILAQRALEWDAWLTSGQADRALACFDADHENFFAALEWAGRAGRSLALCRLVRALARYWGRSPGSARALHWLEQALPSSAVLPAGERGLTWLAIGVGFNDFGQFARARALAAEVIDIAQGLGDAWLHARAALLLSSAAAGMGDSRLALAPLEQALVQPEVDPTYRLAARSIQGVCHLVAADLTRARACWTECDEAHGGARTQARVAPLHNLSLVAHYAGERAEALRLSALAIELERCGRVRPARLTLALLRQVWMHVCGVEPVRAQAVLAEATQVAHDAALGTWQRVCHAHQGKVELACGHLERAFALLRHGLAQCAQSAEPWDLLDLRLHLFWAAWLRDPGEGTAHESLLALVSTACDAWHHEHPRILEAAAVWLRGQRRPVHARRAWQQAAALRTASGLRRFALEERHLAQAGARFAATGGVGRAAQDAAAASLDWLVPLLAMPSARPPLRPAPESCAQPPVRHRARR